LTLKNIRPTLQLHYAHHFNRENFYTSTTNTALHGHKSGSDNVSTLFMIWLYIVYNYKWFTQWLSVVVIAASIVCCYQKFRIFWHSGTGLRAVHTDRFVGDKSDLQIASPTHIYTSADKRLSPTCRLHTNVYGNKKISSADISDQFLGQIFRRQNGRCEQRLTRRAVEVGFKNLCF